MLIKKSFKIKFLKGKDNTLNKWILSIKGNIKTKRQTIH